MKRLGVSKVARSPRGFLTAYKRSGNTLKRDPYWSSKRNGFIARFLPVWRAFRTERVKLALIAWAYMPEGDIRVERRHG